MLFSKKMKIDVDGMTCEHCESTVENGLSELAGIRKVKADHHKDEVSLYYKGELPNLMTIKQKIVDMGYEVTGL